MQTGQHAVGCDFENVALSVRPTLASRPIKVPISPWHQSSLRPSAVIAPGELVQGGLVSVSSHLKHCAGGVGAALVCRPIETAIAARRQRAFRRGAVRED